MKRLVTAALLAALTIPGHAHADNRWSTGNPGSFTLTAPSTGTAHLSITTRDGYPERVGIAQQFERAIVTVAGAKVGETVELADYTATAEATTVLVFDVRAGDRIVIMHSSLAGLSDGTANSFSVDTPVLTVSTPPTSTAAPTSTTSSSTTTPSSSLVETTVPPASTAAPGSSVVATTVEVGPPPVPASTVVAEPHPVAPAVPSALPETGAVTHGLVAAALIVSGVGGLAYLLGRGRREVRS